MAGTLARGREIAAQLSAAGIYATTDSQKITANLPGVLIAPPRIAENSLSGGATITWRIVALAADGTGSELAWEQLDDLIAAVADELPIEVADPLSYQLPNDVPAVPAYVLTFTDSV